MKIEKKVIVRNDEKEEMNMKKYKIQKIDTIVDYYKPIIIEAKNEDEAIEKAKQEDWESESSDFYEQEFKIIE